MSRITRMVDVASRYREILSVLQTGAIIEFTINKRSDQVIMMREGDKVLVHRNLDGYKDHDMAYDLSDWGVANALSDYFKE